MSKPVLIIGGGPAGLAAAHSLASVGKECVIVEKEDKLGGAPILSGYAKLVPTGEWAKDAIGGMVKRVEDEAGVSVITGATVTDFDGTPGDFTAKLSNGDSVDAEAVILCSGFTHFESVNKPEWGRRYDDAGRANDLVRRRCALPVRWPQAESRRDTSLRWLARSPDRPRVVLEDLLHRIVKHGDGNS
jgi:cation diffusion facilitator CzcD-associated flavoprotein CzcO